MKSKRKAFTLMELIVVIAIIVILMMGLAFYGSNSINRTRVQTTENYLKVLASDMEAAFDDYGPYIRNTLLSEEDQSAKLKSFLKTLASDYLHTELNYSSLKIMNYGFTIETIELDPWDTPYTVYYIVDEDTEGNYIIMSNGPDMVSNRDHYLDGQFGDDIVLSTVMQR